MRITLWENAVDLVDKDIINSTVDLPVVIVTSLTVDIYTGVYYLNSTRATKNYYNLAIPELQHLMNSPKNKTIELLEGSASTDRISSTRQLKNRKTLAEILNSLDRDTIASGSQMVKNILNELIGSSLIFEIKISEYNIKNQGTNDFITTRVFPMDYKLEGDMMLTHIDQ
ncbi:hypothetical protein IFM89_016196, partial [Coptis chinensis]